MGQVSHASHTQQAPGWVPANDPADKQILVLDSDPLAREFVTRYLSESGFVVRTAFQTCELESILRSGHVDLVVIHAGASAQANLALCRQFGRPGGPRLIVAGAFEATDRILALELGADDFLAAPYNPRELLARIRAVLRGCRPRATFLESGFRHFLGIKFEFGCPMLRPASGSPITLTPGEFALLAVFLNNPGRVLSRDELLDQARGESDVFDRVIDVQVSRLRQKLARVTPEQVIRTHRHSGYQFVAAVH